MRERTRGVLAARGTSPAAFDWRCIPRGLRWAFRAAGSSTVGMFPLFALPGGRITGLGATLDFHHGLLVFTSTRPCLHRKSVRPLW